jgi:hypothetical protein
LHNPASLQFVSLHSNFSLQFASSTEISEKFVRFAMARKQQDWIGPQETGPKLKLFNSLTRKKEEFVPQEGNIVKWYSCGKFFTRFIIL